MVKRAVKQNIGRERAGLMLYLGNLPLHVGAFYGVGSNGIVLNKRLIRLVAVNSATELNSYIFVLLLHEYLHSLGYLNEQHVRSLVQEISRKTFGADHPATKFATAPPSLKIPPSELQPSGQDIELELIKDFERSNLFYIN